MDAIAIKNLDVVFVDKPKQALELLDQGKTHEDHWWDPAKSVA